VKEAGMDGWNMDGPNPNMWAWIMVIAVMYVFIVVRLLT
jgi:hypothetical protein